MDKLRKHKERLLGRSGDDQTNDNDEEDPSYPLSQTSTTEFAQDSGNRWRADPNRKRASEPSIRYHAAQKELSDGHDLPQRYVSNAGSRFAQLRSSGAVPKTPTTTSAINPLGLTLIYSSPDPVLDVIFIHGLGGTSTQTWSWDRNPENFWLPWLQDDPEIARARIFTYGYDANFKEQYTTSTLLDFAKDLLFRMKTFLPDVEQREITVGRLPIVFVAHSIGGLVSKKAYIIGLNDPQYKEIAEAISAMVFLATPHRGSQDANTLNNILKVTPGGAKAYVAELAKNSFTLQDINEQFRNICEKLKLVSFYETLRTNVGAGISKLIVEKDSAILGYPGEMSDHLVADHHEMTKFRSPLDANYTIVKNLLRWLMRQLDVPSYLSPSQSLAARRSSMSRSSTPIRDEETLGFVRKEIIATETPLKQVRGHLAISEAVEDDLESLSSNHGSYHWLFQRSTFQSWAADNPDAPNLLWLTGQPGSGKTHLASFIIRWLRTRPFIGTCQFHFYLIGHQGKRTLSYLLRSLALQIALIDDEFCTSLLELCADSRINFSQQKATIIWDKVFEGILFRLPPRDTFFWVIDGLDEADTPMELIRLLSKIRSATRIKVLITSRATKELAKEITGLPSIAHETISTEDTLQDIQSFVRDSLQKMSLDDASRSQIIQEILLKASGSFLWVKLALKRIGDNWYTKDDIKSALTEIPAGMEQLYARMIGSIADQSPKLCEMATRILAWVATSFRPLNVSELEVALAPEFRGFTNLKKLIDEICGQFVTVKTASISLIHQTARQFLLRKTANLAININEQEAHKHAAIVCIEFLSDHDKWKRTFTTIQDSRHTKRATGIDSLFSQHPFLLYALSFWAYHVSLASTDSDDFITTILAFLENNCLLWIHGAALTKDLRIITRTAQYLKTYVKRREITLSQSPPTNFAIARDGEMRSWANDLIRVVGRFGIYLSESPSSIYKHVVPFCPQDSIIRTSFPNLGQSSFSVTGISSTGWDDCLARLTMGEDLTASKLLCKDNYFVALVGIDGTLVVWHSETCDEARRITHGEYVTHMASSKTSNLVATAGAKTTKIWDITSGNMIGSLVKNPHRRTKSLAFGDMDDEILVAYDDCSVQCFKMSSEKEGWSFLAKDPTSQDHNCARMISFSPDLSQIAIVFRGRPVQVWTLQYDSPHYVPPKRCVLAEDKMRLAVEGDAWNAPELAIWHTVTYHVLILYEDTKIVDWNVSDDEQTVHSHTGARSMVLSPDGNLLLTSDVQGTLSIWMIPEYRLTYQLRYDELVTDLAFSPEGTRFYDIRGMFCNVWEPAALIRAEEIDRDDMSSAYETITSEPTISNDDNSRVPITALVHSSSDRYYCSGKEDGSVTIYDIPAGTRIRKLFNHSSSSAVIKLAWSASDKYLASADDSGRIIAKRLEPPSAKKNKWAVFPLLDFRIEEAVEFFLFNPRDQYLLIAGPTTARIISLKSKEEISRERHSSKGGVWMNHPTDPAVLVHIQGNQEFQYLWKTMGARELSISHAMSAFSFGEPPISVVRSTQIRTEWLLLETEENTGHNARSSQHRRMELVDLQKLQPSASSGPAESVPRYQVEGFAQHVRLLIGVFQDRVVFLDHQFWLCTWNMELVYSNHKRHFFLPKDWLSPNNLRLITLNKQGTLLCPRNGEAAIIRSGLAQ